MNDRRRTVLIFSIIFLMVFLIFGYTINNYLVEVDWVYGATWWAKFKFYYFSRIFSNLIISTIIAGLITVVFKWKMRK